MIKHLVPIAAALIILSSIPARALSGAEFKDTDERFATGYAWGVIEYWLVSKEGDTLEDIQNKTRQWECFVASKISSKTIYVATKAYIDTKPELLAKPAFAAIIQTAVQICP